MTPKTAFLALVAAAACVPTAAMAMASAELYTTKAYFYGRFDARIQFAPGDGVVSTFFLWKEGSEAANAYWGELDYEKIAADCHMQLNNIYGNPETQHQSTPSMGFAMCEGYHDYRIEWTPTYIAWIVDGKEIRKDTGTNATTYTQNASGGMTFHFNIWPGNSSFGGNINNTKLPVHQYISWVEYSSYDNGNFNVEWREEFQSSGVPSGWAVGNWGSPFNLSTHNVQNVAFVNGIAVMSLTDDNATGKPPTPPADPKAVGGTGGSPGTGGTTAAAGGSGGTQGAGGSSGSGGTSSAGGTTASGGSMASGGRTSAGGTSGSGGMSSTSSSGGTPSSGGTTRQDSTNASGGTRGSGGMSSTSSSGGTAGSGGDDSHSGGTPGSGGSSDPGSTTAAGGSSVTSTTEQTANDGGCSCSASRAASPLWPALLVLAFVVLRLRRKED